MMTPELYLNARKITGEKSDRAPVLGNVEHTWGKEQVTDDNSASSLSFEILFIDGMYDVPEMTKGSIVELRNPATGKNIFTGTIRTATATPGQKDGSLLVRANCADGITEIANEYIYTRWPGFGVRRVQLIEAFQNVGFSLVLPRDGRPSEMANYNSIKLLTMLNKHISRFKATYADSSFRRPNGTLVRQLTVIRSTGRVIPGDRISVEDDGTWNRTYGVPNIEGVNSPLFDIPASNVLLDPEWSQSPENTITAVQIEYMKQGEDGLTESDTSNYNAPLAIRNRYGTQSRDVPTDLMEAADRQEIAALHMDNDAPWKMSSMTIRDSELLSADDLNKLLDAVERHRALVAVSGVMMNRPDAGSSVLRSYVLGGRYFWNGEKWEIALNLERTIYAQPTRLARYVDIRNANHTGISNARLSDIGRILTFADFREIEAPHG